MGLLTNEQYTTYQKGYSFGRLGHTPGVGLRGTRGVGVKNVFFRKSNFVRVTHVNGMYNSTIFWYSPPGALGRGQKVKYHLISITKSILKIFKPNFVCLLVNERYKSY